MRVQPVVYLECRELNGANEAASGPVTRAETQPAVHKAAEPEILRVLNAIKTWNLVREPLFHLADGVPVEIDGLDREAKVAVEVLAHVGKRTPSLDDKVLADAAKLHAIRTVLGRGATVAIVGCDKVFLDSYRGQSKKWHAFVLRAMSVDVIDVDIGMEWIQRIRAAQDEQSRRDREGVAAARRAAAANVGPQGP